MGAALVAALADSGRGWDAIVIGEYERAFYGSQYASMAPLFEHYCLGPPLGSGHMHRISSKRAFVPNGRGFSFGRQAVRAWPGGT